MKLLKLYYEFRLKLDQYLKLILDSSVIKPHTFLTIYTDGKFNALPVTVTVHIKWNFHNFTRYTKIFFGYTARLLNIHNNKTS